MDPEATTLEGEGRFGGTAGSEISFQVVPRDRYGNIWNGGPAAIQVGLNAPKSTVAKCLPTLFF